MLKKLLKYDLKFVYKSVWIFYVLVMFFATLMRIFAGAEQTILMQVLKGIMTGAAISFMFSSVINNLFACWRRLNGNLYGDESYLTHTLPVKRGTIYLSHFLNSIITMLTSILVALIGFFIMFYSKENVEMLRMILEGMAESYGSTPVEMVLLFAVLTFAQMIFIVQAGYTGLVVGHRANTGKMGKSVIWGFVTYGVAQCLILGIVFGIAIFDSGVMQAFTDNTVENIRVLKKMIYIIGVLYVGFVGICGLLNTRLLNKGVNVE